jgi:hypothetical protein
MRSHSEKDKHATNKFDEMAKEKKYQDTVKVTTLELNNTDAPKAFFLELT